MVLVKTLHWARRESRHEAKLMKLAVTAATLGLIKSVVDLVKAIIDWIRN